MKHKLVLGIDIGGTNSVFGLTDKDGEIHFEGSVATKAYTTPDGLVDAIYNVIETSGHLAQLSGIGIGAPNGNYYTGTIDFAPNLNWEGVVPLVELFEKKFNTKVVLTNDANAAAIGEMIYGAAQDLNNFVTITLGTGVGSGVVINGELVYGHDGFAGEYGHIRVINDGRSCGCGRNGCLETYTSANGVIRSITELASPNKQHSSIHGIENPTAEDIFRLAEEGDDFCSEIVEYTAQILGNSLADFACFNSPEAYILFGGIAKSGTEFANRVKAHMEQQILNIYKEKIDVRISSLQDKNAAVLGAASLIWNKDN